MVAKFGVERGLSSSRTGGAGILPASSPQCSMPAGCRRSQALLSGSGVQGAKFLGETSICGGQIGQACCELGQLALRSAGLNFKSWRYPTTEIIAFRGVEC